MGMVKAPEFRSYRSMYDKRVKTNEKHEKSGNRFSLRHAPLVFPKEMTFGISTRYITSELNYI